MFEKLLLDFGGCGECIRGSCFMCRLIGFGD
jgi:hypothetical protein